MFFPIFPDGKNDLMLLVSIPVSGSSPLRDYLEGLEILIYQITWIILIISQVSDMVSEDLQEGQCV